VQKNVALAGAGRLHGQVLPVKVRPGAALSGPRHMMPL